MTVAPNTSSSNVPQNKPEKLSLSATQVAASGLAAVSATVAASYFGVAGTVIGAALGSVITVVGNAVYSYSIRQTRQRVRQGLDVAVAQRFSVDRAAVAESAAIEEGADAVKATRRPTIKPRQLAVAAGALFVVTMGAVTGFELLSGKPLSATVSGSHNSGTTFDPKARTRSTTPTTTAPAVSGPASAASSTSSSGPTATVTITQTQPSSSAPATSSSSSPSAGASSSVPTPSSTPPATASATPSG